jgi:hypothetical protein
MSKAFSYEENRSLRQLLSLPNAHFECAFQQHVITGSAKICNDNAVVNKKSG